MGRHAERMDARLDERLQGLTAEEIETEHVGKFDASDFDKLPFGVIRLSESGEVLTYNATEADMARRSISRTVGKNFFADIAPCTDNPRFRGVLDEMHAAGERSRVFDYRFEFPWGVKDVRVRFLSGGDATTWVFVTPLSDAPAPNN